MKLVTNNNASMNSQQIAELTNKRHDNVKRTIETLFNKGIINRPQNEVIKNDRNQDLSVFIFEGEIGKRASFASITGAWIETPPCSKPKFLGVSRPSRARLFILI